MALLGLDKFTSFKNGGTAKTESSSLLFPSDLESKEYYPECIKFGIYKRAGASLEETGNRAAAGVNRIADKISGRKAAVQLLEEQKAAAVSASFQNNTSSGDQFDFSFGLGGLNDSTPTEFDNRIKQEKDAIGQLINDTTTETKNLLNTITETRNKEIKTPTSRLIQNIYLQMPESLVYSEQVDWQGSDLGVVGGLRDGQFNKATAVAGLLSNAGKVLGGAAGAITSIIPGVGTTAGVLLGTLLGGETGISGGIESTFNVKANPYKEQTFQGVPFRPFEFSFNFRPRSDTEVLQMDKIINAFRAYSKPGFENQGQSGVFAYPHEFLIEFLTFEQGSYVRNPHIPQIKFCICKSVNTNWTTQGWKSFQGGASVDTALTLSFEETEIITQEDVLGETKVGDFASFEGGKF